MISIQRVPLSCCISVQFEDVNASAGSAPDLRSKVEDLKLHFQACFVGEFGGERILTCDGGWKLSHEFPGDDDIVLLCFPNRAGKIFGFFLCFLSLFV